MEDDLKKKEEDDLKKRKKEDDLKKKIKKIKNNLTKSFDVQKLKSFVLCFLEQNGVERAGGINQ